MSWIQISSDVLLTNEGAFVRKIAWIPPMDESWKLNFFAHFEPTHISSSTDMFSCACILRDQNGFFQAACAKHVKLCNDFLVAELKALKKGLKLALKEGVDYLEIEGNVEILRNLLAGDIALFPFSAKTIARKCFDLMLYFRGINVRQAQFHADRAVRKLAGKAVNSKKPSYWQKKISPEIAEILVGDILGRWIPVVV